MKIVIAPDSFKESMTSLEAAKSIEKGMLDTPFSAALRISSPVPLVVVNRGFRCSGGTR